MTHRRRRSRPLKRSTERRFQRRTIKVFCEGKNSEPDYVKGVRRLPHIVERTALSIEIDPIQGSL
jgi:hypothetical protein